MEVGYGDDRRDRIQRERLQSRWMAAYAPVRHLDPVIVLTALALTGIGLIAIYSAKLQALTEQGLPTTLYVTRQLLALVIGIVALVIVALIDYRRLRTYAAVIYGAALILLAAVLTPLGMEAGGAQSWLVIGGLQLQPSELAKVAVLVAVAAVLHECKGNPGFRGTIAALALTMVPVALVLVQPDLGTSMVFVWLVAVLLLVGGVKARYLVSLFLAGVAAFVYGLRSGLIQPYQVERLTAFLHADDLSRAGGALYQTRQSMLAIGSGQFAGKGLFEGTQTALSYVPENHTDFIFTVIGEEFGFLGTSLVLGLFLVLVWRGLRIAMLAKDLFGTLLASGVVAMLTLQIFINVGMTVGIMPVTGLPLPFVSYGGTSLMIWFGLIGLLLNVHMRRF